MVNGHYAHFPLIVFIFTLLITKLVQASPYEVLVVDIARTDNRQKIAGCEKDARQFNSLYREGYLSAKPYFDVLHMPNGQVYFVFGFKGEVQGIHRENYDRTVKNLGRLKNGGAQRYPDMHWVPVKEIRRLLVTP